MHTRHTIRRCVYKVIKKRYFKILVAIDGSKESVNSARYAVGLGKRESLCNSHNGYDASIFIRLVSRRVAMAEKNIQMEEKMV